jgi:hypothetical protein
VLNEEKNMIHEIQASAFGVGTESTADDIKLSGEVNNYPYSG